MKLKGRSILVIALLLFGGFAVFDFYNDKQKDEKKMMEARLLMVPFEQVEQVEIQHQSQQILLKRSVDGWELIEPLKDLADSEAVDDFIKSTVPERIIEVASEGSEVNWSLYGLDQPLGKITFKTTAGAQDAFEISERKNFEENVFARRNGENRVLVLNSIWQTRVKKAALDFRDRRFLRHKIASVDSINLKNDKGVLALARNEGQWSAVDKKDFKLDQNKVRDLLNTISQAKAADIGDKKPSTKSAKKLFTLDLKLDEKKWNAVVEQMSDFSIYAFPSDPEFYLKMEPGALDKLISISLEDLKEAPPEKEAPKGDKSQQKEQK